MTADRLDLDALSRVRAYLDKVDVVNARMGGGWQYGDEIHGIDMVALSRDDMRRVVDAFEAAQAALARVTDEAMQRRLAESIGAVVGVGGGREWTAARDVLAMIRAVAGEGQEAGGK